LLRYKINSSEKVRSQLNHPGASLNLDSKSSSLKYSFNEMMHTFGIFSGSLIKFTDRASPLAIYLTIVILAIISIKLISKKSDHFKTKFASMTGGLMFGLFTYAVVVSLHSGSGQIFRFISLILLSLTAGTLLSVKLIKNKIPLTSVSYMRIFLMLSSIFLILLPTGFEITLTSVSVVSAVFLSLAGGFLFGGTQYHGITTLKELTSERETTVYILWGVTASCLGGIFLIPVMGTIETFPALGILGLSGVIVLST
jgi:hypothetical protein